MTTAPNPHRLHARRLGIDTQHENVRNVFVDRRVFNGGLHR
jgi:hypothetical protein